MAALSAGQKESEEVAVEAIRPGGGILAAPGRGGPTGTKKGVAWMTRILVGGLASTGVLAKPFLSLHEGEGSAVATRNPSRAESRGGTSQSGFAGERFVSSRCVHQQGVFGEMMGKVDGVDH